MRAFLRADEWAVQWADEWDVQWAVSRADLLDESRAGPKAGPMVGLKESKTVDLKDGSTDLMPAAKWAE